MITDGGQFCYWDSKSTQDTIVMIWNLCIVLILMIYSIRVYFRTRRKLTHQGINKLFALLLAWALGYGFGIIFSIILYFTKFNNADNYQKDDITFFSRIYQFIETVPALIIQIILFYVPLKMIYNIMSLYELNRWVPKPSDIKRYQRLKKYQKIRPFFLIFWVLVVFPFAPQVEQILTQVKTMFILIDCSACVVALYYTRLICLQNSQKLLLENKKAQQRLKQQTTSLAVCCVGRFLMDLLYYVFFPLIKGYNNQRQCIEPITEHYEFTIGYLIVGPFLMYYLSVIVIIRMYQFDPDEQKGNSLNDSFLVPQKCPEDILEGEYI